VKEGILTRQKATQIILILIFNQLSRIIEYNYIALYIKLHYIVLNRIIKVSSNERNINSSPSGIFSVSIDYDNK